MNQEQIYKDAQRPKMPRDQQKQFNEHNKALIEQIKKQYKGQAPLQDIEYYGPDIRQMYDDMYEWEYLAYIYQINDWEKKKLVSQSNMKKLQEEEEEEEEKEKLEAKQEEEKRRQEIDQEQGMEIYMQKLFDRLSQPKHYK